MFLVRKRTKAAWLGVLLGLAIGGVLVGVLTPSGVFPALPAYAHSLWTRLAAVSFSLSLPLLTVLLLGSGLVGVCLGWRSERHEHLRLLKELRDSLAEAREESRTAWTAWAKWAARTSAAPAAAPGRAVDHEGIVTVQARVIQVSDGSWSEKVRNGQRKD